MSQINVNTISNASGTSAITIDSSGNTDMKGFVTKDKPVVWEVSRTGSVAGGNVWITNRVIIDTSSAVNTSTGQFIAPVTGYYYTQFTWLSNSTAELTDVHIRVAADATSDHKRIRAQGHTNHISTSGHRIVHLDAGDYLEVYVSSGTVYGDTNPWSTWSGYLIG